METRKESGVFLFENVSSELILRFFREYRFHENSDDLNSKLISAYIRAQNALGDLRKWNVAVMTRSSASLGQIDMGLSEKVNLINRARMKGLGGRSGSYANIKALMSKADLVVDRNMSARDIAIMETDDLISLRTADDPGLLLLYPIAKNSKPANVGRGVREPLDALKHVIGVGMVFPAAREKTPQDYLTVDLSSVQREIPEDEVEEDEVA